MNLKITIRHKKENKYMRTKLIFSPQLAQYLLREGETSEEELDEKRLEIEKFKLNLFSMKFIE